MLHPTRRSVLILAAALAVTPSWAQSTQSAKPEPIRGERRVGPLTVITTDLSPQFLAFVEAAETEADPERRWDLFKALYGYAAVPPTPQGEQMARAKLDAAWPTIDRLRPVAETGLAGLGEAPFATLVEVARLLGLTEPATLELVGYVGLNDWGAFAFRGRYPTLNIPLELPPERLPLTVAHEGTHVLQMTLSGAGGGWVRSVATTAFQEGLAMHVSAAVVPGRDDAAYVGGRPGWWEQVSAKHAAILSGMVPHLTETSGEAVTRFTLGQGVTGSVREAYAAGWWAVGQLLNDGRTFPELARTPETEHPALMAEAIRRLQA